MATTSQITPGKDKDVSKEIGGESPSLLDAKVVGGNGANGVGSVENLQDEWVVIQGPVMRLYSGEGQLCSDESGLFRILRVPANSP